MLRVTFLLLVGLMAAAVAAGQAFERLYAPQPVAAEVRVYNASRINTPGLEFCPVIYENGLVYVSRYENGPIDPRTGQTYFELFYAELDPTGMPGKPVSFSTEINSAYHEGPVSFNRQGDRIFFTRTNTRQGVRRSDSKGRSGLKIYEAQRGAFDWENVQELSFNSDEYTCMHPALSDDQTKLYFASDMPGGFGGMDLYVVDWREGTWSAPINLGPEVNTSKNEAFPFFHESGTLFFASDGHPGLGNYDIFMINMSGRRWGQVINLGEPFNSPQDDLGLVLRADGEQGYFTSSRLGGFGEDDIYLFATPGGMKGLTRPPGINHVVTVYDGVSSRRLPGASVWLYEVAADGIVNNEALYNLELVPADDSGNMVLKPVRKPEEELGDPYTATDRVGESAITLKPETNYLLLVAKAGFTTQEFVFSTNETAADRPLEILLTPSNCITLNGMVRSDRYDLPIPNVVVRISNDCDDQVVVTRSNINGEFETCLLLGCEYTITAQKPGYDEGASKVSTVRARGTRSMVAEVRIHPNSDAILREPIPRGTVILLENILYDFNKSAIRKGADRDLNALAQLMLAYPSMEIELGAHTDSRGTEEYNLDLSLRRAESAKQFLVQKGIAPNRISAVGHGERYLRNGCVDGVECTEAEHIRNRRTEVKILRIDESAQINITQDGLAPPDDNNNR